MRSPTCPRLAIELAVMHRMPHVTADDITQRITDHQRWHVDCHDYQPAPGLTRDPRDNPEETR